ncbi:RimK family alpha-L-glutamate ligase [Candidatus Woesearchaeota archaeon]|nr:RimK family alpha-L-glutamate ligase [Candidatus Woesearchaeota archaeon]MBW3006459.1 RimK family alpha-L-glutamate ligase [Candidatus Woesearchaeota archaeon]
MKAALISMGSISSKWTVDAMKKYFKSADHIDIKALEVSIGRGGDILYEGKPLKEYDCIYAKGSYRYANLLRSVTTILSKQCYMPIKGSAFSTGHDKLLTHIKLMDAGIPMPKTYLASTAEAAKKVLKEIHYPVVLKLPAGTHGKGVMLADSEESASTMIDTLLLLKQPFLLQEYIETGGVDIRAFVVGDKVVAAMKRKAVTGEKRANIHAGAKGEAVTLDQKTKKVAIQTAQAAGCAICAVDILESARGPMVIEFNLSPGLQGITKATKVDVADKIAKYLYEQTKLRKEVGQEKKEKKTMTELLPEQEILTKLDFRGERILLPAFVSKLAKFKEDKDVIVKANKGKLFIEECE